MNYLTFAVYNKDDNNDTRSYLYNEALYNSSDMEVIIKESKEFILSDLISEGKNPKLYRYKKEIKSYRDIGKNLDSYKIIDIHPDTREPNLLHYKDLFIKDESMFYKS